MAATAIQRVRLPRAGGHLSRYVLRRVALAALTLWLVTIVVFFITNILPGNPAVVRLGGLASPEAVRAVLTPRTKAVIPGARALLGLRQRRGGR